MWPSAPNSSYQLGEQLLASAKLTNLGSRVRGTQCLHAKPVLRLSRFEHFVIFSVAGRQLEGCGPALSFFTMRFIVLSRLFLTVCLATSSVEPIRNAVTHRCLIRTLNSVNGCRAFRQCCVAECGGPENLLRAQCSDESGELEGTCACAASGRAT